MILLFLLMCLKDPVRTNWSKLLLLPPPSRPMAQLTRKALDARSPFSVIAGELMLSYRLLATFYAHAPALKSGSRSKTPH